jgi:hypothetical protein
MNLKKFLRNKAAMILVGTASRPPQACSVRLIAIAKLSNEIAIRAEFQPPHMRMVRRNGMVFGVNMAALFIELSGKI